MQNFLHKKFKQKKSYYFFALLFFSTHIFTVDFAEYAVKNVRDIIQINELEFSPNDKIVNGIKIAPGLSLNCHLDKIIPMQSHYDFEENRK
jgi:hypothetical protein